jgi:hypothetical protein
MTATIDRVEKLVGAFSRVRGLAWQDWSAAA